MTTFELNQRRKQIYILFSVDTEHDTISDHRTRTAGWTNGIPWLFETFNSLEMTGKVCWLIEYNLKEGLPAGNPNSEFFVKEFPELITQIKTRGDEIGIHPTMYDWVGGEKQISAERYNDSNLWDRKRSYTDPEFVTNLITSAVKELRTLSGVHPIGCRTAACHFATHLAEALEKNGVDLDSSAIGFHGKRIVTAPNAYYASREDIRRKSSSPTRVLEIPYVSCGQFIIQKPLTRIRTEYLLNQPKTIFLSLLIHNWTAIDTNGNKNQYFLENFRSFMSFLRNRGASFVSWMQAKEIFDSMYLTK
jgi:hypothetical protein